MMTTFKMKMVIISVVPVLKIEMMVHEDDDRFYYTALKMKMMIVCIAPH